MPIGGVLATKDVIVPNAVGVDIGCGMRAMKTDISVEEFMPHIKGIMRQIREQIPVGFEHNKIPDWMAMPTMGSLAQDEFPVVFKEWDSAAKQIGTLGGGNHFIEIQKDGDNKIWIMIHSGSRNLGYKVANHYNNLAKKLNDIYFSSVPLKWDLAFLPIEIIEATNYLREMEYCIDFASNNRWKMMGVIKEVISSDLDYQILKEIDIPHNYVSLENHLDRNVYIHRKGATSAKSGQIGIIPGSQGTCSYIVRGLGNIDSFRSCSHGAGRKMGRKQAKKLLDLETEQFRMNDMNILHSIRGKDDLDEAPGAYKDINTVMVQQEDLVTIETKLYPIGVVKG